MTDDGDPPPSPRRRQRVPVNPHEPTQAFPRVAPPRIGPPSRPAATVKAGAPRSSAQPTHATQPTQRIDVGVRPEAPAPVPPADARPRRSIAQIALLTLVSLLAVGAAVVVGTRSMRPEQDDGTGGVATGTPNAKHPPQKDVSLGGCKLDATGVAVDGEVRNPTDDPADYVIEVHLVGPDGATITSGSPTAQDVPAGARVAWAGTLPPVRSNAPSATCKLVRVDRYRSD